MFFICSTIVLCQRLIILCSAIRFDRRRSPDALDARPLGNERSLDRVVGVNDPVVSAFIADKVGCYTSFCSDDFTVHCTRCHIDSAVSGNPVVLLWSDMEVKACVN